MNKIKILIFLFCIMFFLSSCGESIQENTQSSEPQVSSTIDNVSGFEKYYSDNNTIDEDYRQEIMNNSSSEQMQQSAAHYLEAWKQEEEYAYNLIISSIEEKNADEIKDEESKWKSETQDKINDLKEKSKDMGSGANLYILSESMSIYRDRTKSIYRRLYNISQDFKFKYQPKFKNTQNESAVDSQ